MTVWLRHAEQMWQGSTYERRHRWPMTDWQLPRCQTEMLS